MIVSRDYVRTFMYHVIHIRFHSVSDSANEVQEVSTQSWEVLLLVGLLLDKQNVLSPIGRGTNSSIVRRQCGVFFFLPRRSSLLSWA